MNARTLKKFWNSLKRVSPILLLRFIFTAIVLLPLWGWVILVSFIRSWRWRRVGIYRKFIEHRRLAFDDVDETTISLQRLSGGISNLSLILSCKTYSGEVRKYFVKLFLPLGTFWANVTPVVSSYPYIYGSHSPQRFTVDMVSRAQLADVDVPVSKLIAYDSRAKVMVSQYIIGQTLDDILHELSKEENIPPEKWEPFRQCGAGVGKAHAAGFSMVDIHPGNCMWVPCQGLTYFIDLEHCSREDLRAWDLAYFFFFLDTLAAPTLSQYAQKAFLDGYQQYFTPAWDEIQNVHIHLKDYSSAFKAYLDMQNLADRNN